jgi:hypothetical protein
VSLFLICFIEQNQARHYPSPQLLVDLHSSISEQNNNKKEKDKKKEDKKKKKKKEETKAKTSPLTFLRLTPLFVMRAPAVPFFFSSFFSVLLSPQAFAFFDRLSIVSATLGSFMHEVQAEFALELGA